MLLILLHIKNLCVPISNIIDITAASDIIISVNFTIAKDDASIIKLKNIPTPINNAICTKNTLYGMFIQSFLTCLISSYVIFSFLKYLFKYFYMFLISTLKEIQCIENPNMNATAYCCTCVSVCTSL